MARAKAPWAVPWRRSSDSSWWTVISKSNGSAAKAFPNIFASEGEAAFG